MNSSILSSLSPSNSTTLGNFTDMFNYVGGAKSTNPLTAFYNSETQLIQQVAGYNIITCLVMFLMMVVFAIIGFVSTVSWGAYQTKIDATSDEGSTDQLESGRYTSGVVAAVFTSLTIAVAFGLIFYMYYHARQCKGLQLVSPK